jgi:hypothetical protein
LNSAKGSGGSINRSKSENLKPSDLQEENVIKIDTEKAEKIVKLKTTIDSKQN